MTDKIRLYRFPADHDLPLWQWNMLRWAVSNLNPLGTLHLIGPHRFWNSSSSLCEVLCLYPTYCPNKLPEKVWVQCVMHHIVCLVISPSVSRTQQFNTLSIKYSLYPLASRSHISWHFYQEFKWFQSSWHSPRVKAIFLRDFRPIMEQCFITAAPNVTCVI